MEGLKSFVEFITAYPLWAKCLSGPGFVIGIGTLVLAPRSATEIVHGAAIERLRSKLVPQPGYDVRVYPSLGVGLLLPSSWKSEDAVVRFGGGEADLVKRFEDTKGIVGIKLRLRSVQDNYINDLNTEVQNQLDVLVGVDPSANVVDYTIAGQIGKKFVYSQSTGKRKGEINLYWLRLIPQIKLEIIAFIYQDAKDRSEFWKEVDQVIKSLVLDDQGISERAKVLKNKD